MDKEKIFKISEEINTGLYEKAKKRIFSLLKDSPRDPFLLNKLATLYLYLGNLKIAKKVLSKIRGHSFAEKNIEIIKKIEDYGKYRYTFFIFIEKEKNTKNIWKNLIKNKALPKDSQYFFLFLSPSPHTVSFLKKYKIPSIFGDDLVDLINRGLIEKRGSKTIFIPSSLLKEVEKELLSPLNLFVIGKTGKDNILGFSLDSSLFSMVGILRRDLDFKEAIEEYKKRIEEHKIRINYIEIKKKIELENPDNSKISLCMIVKDEEENIERCLRSVKGLVDEMIVLDTGSTDKTPDIAKKLGAKVFYSKWKDDFSLARNESISYARYPWIFWLDADDYIKEEDRGNFLKFKKNLPKTKYMAFRMPTLSTRKGIFNKKDVNYLTRIFRNHPEIKFEGRIHEQVLFSIARLKGKVGTVDIPIYHTGYEDPDTLRKKKGRNKKLLEKALEDDPENPIYLTYLGRIYMEEWFDGKGDIKKAEECLKKAIYLFPSEEINYLSYAYLNLSLIYYHAKKFEDAIEYAKKAINTNKDIESAYEVWGRSLIYLGRFKDAEKVFLELENNVDRESPSYIKISDFDYRYFLAISQFNIENYRDAIENFKKVNVTKREEENIDFFIGVAYYKLKEYENAISYLKRSIEKNPTHYDAWNNLGNVYMTINKYEKAKECYIKALNIKKGQEALFGLANIYYIKDDYERAKEYFLYSMESHHPKKELMERAYFYLANIYFIEKDYNNSKKYLEKIENTNIIGKDYFLLFYNLLNTIGEKENALKKLAEALTYYEYDAEFMELFANELEAQGKIPEAISVWEELFKIKNDIEIMYKLGILYAKIGAFHDAINYFEKLLEEKPDDIRVYNDLGVFYGLIGNLEKAKKFFHQALKIDPNNKIAKSNLDKIIFKENRKNLY